MYVNVDMSTNVCICCYLTYANFNRSFKFFMCLTYLKMNENEHLFMYVRIFVKIGSHENHVL